MNTSFILLGALALSAADPMNGANGNEESGAERTSPLTLIANDSVTAKLEGRVQVDFTWATGDAPYETQDGIDFRRAYIGASGTIYDTIKYKAAFDMASGGVLTDVFMTLTGTAIGDVTVGHFKEPFALEEMTSNKYLSFAERSLANTFSPSRNSGLMVSDTCADDQVSWAAGIFRDTDSFGDDNTEKEADNPDESDSEYAVTARVTGTVWNEDEGKDVLHVGGAISHRYADDGKESFSTRPEAHLLPNIASVSFADAESTNLIGVEAAWVNGPLSFQGEYNMASVSGDNGTPDGDFSGFYVEGTYFLTGENRVYKSKGGTFGRVKPHENYANGSGGAWMVGARYSMVDLDDGPGTIDVSNITLGATWILNPNTRVVFNLIHSEADDSATTDGDADIGLVRFQFDF